MNASQLVVLLTGATGGIGQATARELARRGAALLLTARDATALDRLARDLALPAERCLVVPADLTDASDRARLVVAALNWKWGVNALVNNAGVGDLTLVGDVSAEQVEVTLATNVAAPMHLCRALLPRLLTLPEAHVLNVGSVFGAIGYPGYTTYCAAKFALRGFSEALGRELSDTTVQVHYLAPRATRTSMNDATVEAMNAALGVAMDPPERVAAALVDMLAGRRRRAVVGWPEKFFARLNGALPGLVDRALARQLPGIRRHAARTGVPVATNATQDIRRKYG